MSQGCERYPGHFDHLITKWLVLDKEVPDFLGQNRKIKKNYLHDPSVLVSWGNSGTSQRSCHVHKEAVCWPQGNDTGHVCFVSLTLTSKNVWHHISEVYIYHQADLNGVLVWDGHPSHSTLCCLATASPGEKNVLFQFRSIGLLFSDKALPKGLKQDRSCKI